MKIKIRKPDLCASSNCCCSHAEVRRVAPGLRRLSGSQHGKGESVNRLGKSTRRTLVHGQLLLSNTNAYR